MIERKCNEGGNDKRYSRREEDERANSSPATVEFILNAVDVYTTEIIE